VELDSVEEKKEKMKLMELIPIPGDPL